MYTSLGFCLQFELQSTKLLIEFWLFARTWTVDFNYHLRLPQHNMVSACVTFNTNTHIANSRKDNVFRQDNGFLGERIKGGLSYSPWISNQLDISLRTQERVKKAKPGVVSAILTSDNAKESLVSWIICSELCYGLDQYDRKTRSFVSVVGCTFLCHYYLVNDSVLIIVGVSISDLSGAIVSEKKCGPQKCCFHHIGRRSWVSALPSYQTNCHTCCE